jgi:cytochrome b6-f complex iron-sulfur subunit
MTMLPVQVEQTECVECVKRSRRDFLASGAAAAITAVLATACGGNGGGDTVTGPVSLTVQVSSYTALANVGGMARVTASGTPIAVVRTGMDTFAAYSLICPHRGCTVDINGSGFVCPCHGARFSSTGAWTGGQQTSSLTSLTTSYDPATGTLTISH